MTDPAATDSGSAAGISFDPSLISAAQLVDPHHFLQDRLAASVCSWLLAHSDLLSVRRWTEIVPDTGHWLQLLSPGIRTCFLGTLLGRLLVPVEGPAAATAVAGAEQYPLLASTVREVLRRNGASDSLLVCDKPWESIRLAEDLRSPDQIVFVDFDHTLLGTGWLQATRVLQQQQQQQQPGAAPLTVLPAQARLWIQLVGDSGTGVAEQQWSPIVEAVTEKAYEALSERTWLEDLICRAAIGQRLVCPVHVTRGGRACGFLYGYELLLPDGVGVSSSEFAVKRAFQYIDPVDLNIGNLDVVIAVAETRLVFESPAARALRVHAALPYTYYMTMVMDEERNNAYNEGLKNLKRTIQPRRIYEPGCGTGCLMTMATKAFPNARLMGCDISQAALDIARRTVPTAKLIYRELRMFKPKKPAGLVMFELFDTGLIGEGILYMLPVIRKQLLAPSGILLPCGGKIMAQLAQHRLEKDSNGIDISSANRALWAPEYGTVQAGQYTPLSDPFMVQDFDFYTASPDPMQRQFVVRTTRSGICSAIIFWFVLRMTEKGPLLDSSRESNWNLACQYTGPEFAVAKGAVVPVVAAHDGAHLQFSFPKISRADHVYPPRPDALWLQRAARLSVLEQQIMAAFGHASARAQIFRAAATLAAASGVFGLAAETCRKFVDTLMRELQPGK